MPDLLIKEYGRKISQGALSNIFDELKEEFEDEYKEIGEKIRKSEVVGADETGARIGGKKAWMWVFRTDLLSFFKAAYTRSHTCSA